MASAETIPYEKLRSCLNSATTEDELYELVANVPFDYKLETAFLFLGFISFFVVSPLKHMACLVGVSDTEEYKLAVKGFKFDPNDYHVPLTDIENSIVRAIIEDRPVVTSDWGTLSRPQTPEEVARLNQASSGIAHSVVYPLPGVQKGAIMYNFFQYSEDMGPLQSEFMTRYANLVAEVLNERSRKAATIK